MIEVLSRMRLPVAPVLPDEVARKADLVAGESVNYSLEPTNTQVRWIDGQFVFRRVFIAVSGAAANTANTIIHVPGAGWGFHGLVRLDGYLLSATEERIPLSYYATTTDYIGVKITSTGDIIERHGGAAMNSRSMVLIIDYLSAPTGGSSWDGATTVWDDGQSSWDVVVGATQPLWDGDPNTVWDR